MPPKHPPRRGRVPKFQSIPELAIPVAMGIICHPHALTESRSRVKSSILRCNSMTDAAAFPVRWDCVSSNCCNRLPVPPSRTPRSTKFLHAMICSFFDRQKLGTRLISHAQNLTHGCAWCLTAHRGDQPSRASPVHTSQSVGCVCYCNQRLANALSEEMPIMRDHLFFQARKADLRITGGASLDRAVMADFGQTDFSQF